MSLRINHNIAAANGHRNMAKNDAAVSKSLERLSSGLRINRAADDAAGLIISEQMRSQLTGLNQAINNSEQAVTMIQTAEGALDEVSTLLNKARSLAIHAANEGINSTDQLVADQSELDNIIESVDRIAANTQFGNKKLLDGSLSTATPNNSAIASVKLGGDYTSALNNGTASKGYHTLAITQAATQSNIIISMSGGDLDIFSAGSLSAAVATDTVNKGFSLNINGAVLSVSSGTTKGQILQQLNSIGNQIGFTAATEVGSTSGEGNITLVARDYGSSFKFDVQYAGGATGATVIQTDSVATVGFDATATLFIYTGEAGLNSTANTGSATTIDFKADSSAGFPGGVGLRMVSSGGSTIVLSTSIGSGTVIQGAINGSSSGATFQIGANVNQTATVQLNSTRTDLLGIGGSGLYNSLGQLKGTGLVSGNAQEALKVIDKSIDDITKIRGNLGAFQSNTLETSLSSLRVTQENLTSAESTIRDVDFAQESANFTKNNILVQASTAMLAQANQLPQQVLKLLQ